MEEWKKEILQGSPNLSYDTEFGIYCAEFEGNLATQFHLKMPKGPALREFKDAHLHLSYWESPYYTQAIERFIDEIVCPEDKLALDIGCGDGRFTELLLRKGFGRVIAMDTHLPALHSLADFAMQKNLQDRLMIMYCSAESVPLPDSCADLALSIGVFYYLNEKFEEALSQAWRVLKAGAVLVNSEPDLEGAVYKSLFFEDVEDVIENVRFRRFKEEKGKTPYKFRLFAQNEIRELLCKSGFRILDCHGLSLLPSILRIKMVREELAVDEISRREKELRHIFDYFDEHGTLCKHMIWKSVKYQR